jgi:hypothetical protein
MFSPGPLAATHSQAKPLQGFTSHADFENECYRCHIPWRGAVAARCLACHTLVDSQIQSGRGLHSALPEVTICLTCHTDHLGREARLTRSRAFDFSHEAMTGFSLVRHPVDYDGSALACIACHSQESYFFEVTTACIDCHTKAQATFMPRHRADFGDDCLACHDGKNEPAPIDHAAFFPLTGRHASIACVDCHQDHQFKGTPRDCRSCHLEDDIHQGQLGNECSLCHTTNSWPDLQMTLKNHTFPLTHQNNGQLIACRVCHTFVNNLVFYSCYGCHAHNPAKIEREHLDKGIRNVANCVECHATGDKPEDEDDDRERENDD